MALISEILNEFNQAGTRDLKKNVLLRNRANMSLQHTIRGAMHPRIRFKFNQKTLPEHKSVSEIPTGMGYVTVASELRKLYLFEDGNPKCPANLKDIKRAQLLRATLEGMDRGEAAVYIGIITKNLPVNGMTRDLVEEVWPGILTNQGW